MSLIIPNFKDFNGQTLANLPEVVLARMLYQAEKPVQLAFLQHLYTLNRSLRETGLQDVPYWNAFDELQQVQEQDGLPLTIYDFPLNEEIDPFFNNSGNQVLLYRHNVLIAEVKVHNQIEVEQVIHFLADGSQKIDNYDDRGFLSTTKWMTADHNFAKLQWFTPFKEVVAEMDVHRQVIISPQFRSCFWQSDYQELNQLLEELYKRHFECPSVVIAAFRSGATTQNRFYLRLPAVDKIALLDPDASLVKVKAEVAKNKKTKWVFPSQILKQKFLAKDDDYELDSQLKVIEPYPTNFSLGTSNEIEAQIIYWQFSNQSDEVFAKSLQYIFPLLWENENLFLLIDTSARQKSQLEELANQWIMKLTNVDTNSEKYNRYFEIGKPDEFSSEAEWLDYLDEHLEEEPIELDKNELHQFYQVGYFLARVKAVDEKDDLVETFSNIRLFIDQGPDADLRKQILAISVGVPIISFAPTDLVKQSGNGFQATEIDQLSSQINYFLDDLHHWNQSLVDSVVLIEKYAPNQLLKRWKEVITDG